MTAPGILLIAGPTASGKTALALALAEALGGEVVNADSMQVYRDLRVLTARPTAEDEKRAPHHLFGHVDADTPYSVGAWAREAVALIREINDRDRPAIIVGGTGLYFHSLTVGVADIPDPGHEAQAHAQGLLARDGVEGLRRAAEEVDPVATANVHGADRQRLLRIVAVAEGLGVPLSSFWSATCAPLAAGSWSALAIEPPQEQLHAAITARAAAMMKDGAREEVEALLARKLDPERPAMKALGVSTVRAVLDGELEADEAATLIARDTRRYAKRQLTWMRGRMADWPRLQKPDLAAARPILERSQADRAGEGAAS